MGDAPVWPVEALGTWLTQIKAHRSDGAVVAAHWPKLETVAVLVYLAPPLDCAGGFHGEVVAPCADGA